MFCEFSKPIRGSFLIVIEKCDMSAPRLSYSSVARVRNTRKVLLKALKSIAEGIPVKRNNLGHLSIRSVVNDDDFILKTANSSLLYAASDGRK